MILLANWKLQAESRFMLPIYPEMRRSTIIIKIWMKFIFWGEKAICGLNVSFHINLHIKSSLIDLFVHTIVFVIDRLVIHHNNTTIILRKNWEDDAINLMQVHYHLIISDYYSCNLRCMTSLSLINTIVHTKKYNNGFLICRFMGNETFHRQNAFFLAKNTISFKFL